MDMDRPMRPTCIDCKHNWSVLTSPFCFTI